MTYRPVLRHPDETVPRLLITLYEISINRIRRIAGHHQQHGYLMATVTKIPATVSRFTAAPIAVKQKRKVAAYARVSTDHEDQLNSYEAQCDYYEHYIRANDEWEYAGLYSDEGISGTSTKRRNGFNQMVEDALAGRIGLILTKSVSRFARNTVDSLTTIRKLKEHGTEVYFEKENIGIRFTLNSGSEIKA